MLKHYSLNVGYNFIALLMQPKCILCIIKNLADTQCSSDSGSQQNKIYVLLVISISTAKLYYRFIKFDFKFKKLYNKNLAKSLTHT